MRMYCALALAATVGTAHAQTITPDQIRAAVGPIDTAAIIANDAHDRNWLNYGLNYAETRYSQLDAINADNVEELGLEWSYDLQSRRGVEATPIVVEPLVVHIAVEHDPPTRGPSRSFTRDRGDRSRRVMARHRPASPIGRVRGPPRRSPEARAKPGRPRTLRRSAADFGHRGRARH